MPPSGGRNEAVNFHGESLSNATHESKTDRDVRLYRKSQGTTARLSDIGHLLTQNRNGLTVPMFVVNLS